MIRTLSTLAGLLIAGSAAAAPISSWQVTNHFIQDGFTTAVVDTASLSTEVYVDFITQFKAPVAVGQAVVVSLTSGALFDQMVALYTNGVTDFDTDLFGVNFSFSASLDGAPPFNFSWGQYVKDEFADLPDLAGWAIDEIRFTATIDCFDSDPTRGSDACGVPSQTPKLEIQATYGAEFFGHQAGTNVPEPGSALLAATALLLAFGTARRAGLRP